MEQILHAYPELVQEDISAALEYASQIIDEEKVIARVENSFSLKALLDQNVPGEVGTWLQNLRPTWQVVHAS